MAADVLRCCSDRYWSMPLRSSRVSSEEEEEAGAAEALALFILRFICIFMRVAMGICILLSTSSKCSPLLLFFLPLPLEWLSLSVFMLASGVVDRSLPDPHSVNIGGRAAECALDSDLDLPAVAAWLGLRLYVGKH